MLFRQYSRQNLHVRNTHWLLSKVVTVFIAESHIILIAKYSLVYIQKSLVVAVQKSLVGFEVAVNVLPKWNVQIDSSVTALV